MWAMQDKAHRGSQCEYTGPVLASRTVGGGENKKIYAKRCWVVDQSREGSYQCPQAEEEATSGHKNRSLLLKVISGERAQLGI